MAIYFLNIDSLFFYILWTLALIPATLQLNYFSLFFLSFAKKTDSVEKNFKKKNFPKVSILIPSYNEKFVIKNTIKNLEKLKYPKNKLQVIIIDDSDDGTHEIISNELSKLKNLGIETKFIHRKWRKGLKSGALNDGLKFAEGKYILCLDADVIVSKDFLKKAIPYMLNNPEKKYVNFKCDFYNKNFNIITKAYSFSTFVSYHIIKRTLSHFKIPFSCYGDCALFETDFLRKIGGWRPNIIADDADVSFRTWSNGGTGEYAEHQPLCKIEANPSFTILKQKTQRISRGVAQAFSKNLKGILKSNLSLFQKVEFLLSGMWPLIGLLSLLFTFVSFMGLVLSIQSVQKIFTSTNYILISMFFYSYLIISVFATMKFRKLPLKDYILTLAISGYILGPLSIYSTIGFLEGLLNKRINFFKAPKFGSMENYKNNYKPSMLSKFGIVELSLVILSLIFALISIQKQLYYVTFVSSSYLFLILLASLYI